VSLHYLAKHECQKTGGNLKCIVLNDKSQGSTMKHLSCDGLVHYKSIVQFAAEIIYKIGEHLAKLEAKWSIASTFALKDVELAR